MNTTLPQDFKNSIYDGIFANMFATLTGGLFLTGFALYLGMNDFMIGLLSAVPFFATIFQIPASYYIEKKGRRKSFAVNAAQIARALWLPVLIIAILPDMALEIKIFIVLFLIFISNAFVSIGFVSWLSWISDIVPENVRGRFFGTRNMMCGAAGIATMLIFGGLLDYLKTSNKMALGFSIILVAAVLFGMQSIYFLKKISEPVRQEIAQWNMPFWRGIRLPFEDYNFRRFIIFSCTWSFSVYFASPFFTLYFLRDLQFSYMFIAALGTLSALADLVGMHFWGRISDKVKNKVVIRVASWVAIFIPLIWVTVLPGSVIMPIILHIISGGFWSGINLCMNNLLFGIAPKEHKTFYLSAYNIAGGAGAAIGPVLAGLILAQLNGFGFEIMSFKIVPLHVVFITSTFLRLLSSRFLLKRIKEPEETEPIQVIRIIRNVRALNVASGFNHLLHPFVEIFKEVESEE